MQPFRMDAHLLRSSYRAAPGCDFVVVVRRWSIYTELTMCMISGTALAKMSAPEDSGADLGWAQVSLVTLSVRVRVTRYTHIAWLPEQPRTLVYALCSRVREVGGCKGYCWSITFLNIPHLQQQQVGGCM